MGYTHTIVRSINYGGKVKETKTTEEVFGCPVTEDFEKVETPEKVNVLPVADVTEEITEKVKELREEREAEASKEEQTQTEEVKEEQTQSPAPKKTRSKKA